MKKTLIFLSLILNINAYASPWLLYSSNTNECKFDPELNPDKTLCYNSQTVH